MSKESSGFTLGPMGILLIILLFNWFSDDDEKEAVKEDVKKVQEKVEDVVDKVKAKVEEDTTFQSTSNDFKDDEFVEDIEWADE